MEIFKIVLIGIGATAVMDLWLALLKRLGVPVQSFAMIGRWAAHLAHGRLAHAAIARAPAMQGELALGWLTHYAVGVVFAALLVAVNGAAWISNPTVLPALAVGVATVAMPLCVMQPAMGAGFAASKTPTPFRNCLRSVANHTVFGLGLYWSAAIIAMF